MFFSTLVYFHCGLALVPVAAPYLFFVRRFYITMPLKRITLIVLVCLILAFCISIALFPFAQMQMSPRLYGSLAGLLLRDLSLITFLAFLYRRST
jgi:hypothetical protein